MGGVPDLGVELQTHESPFRVEDGRHLGGGSTGQDLKTIGDPFHQIAVAHPHRLFPGRTDKHRLLDDDLELRETVLAVRRGPHVPAEVARHEVEAVADTQNRNTKRENRPVDLRRPVLEDAGRPARKHNRNRRQSLDLTCRKVAAFDDRLDPKLPQTARDQLRVLRPEIEDENDLVLHASSPAR